MYSTLYAALAATIVESWLSRKRLQYNAAEQLIETGNRIKAFDAVSLMIKKDTCTKQDS